MPPPTPAAGFRLDELALRCGATRRRRRRHPDRACRARSSMRDPATSRSSPIHATGRSSRARAQQPSSSHRLIAGATSLPKLIAADPYATYARGGRCPAPAGGGGGGRSSDGGRRSVGQRRGDGGGRALRGDRRRASIGERASIGAHCTIGEGASVGDDCGARRPTSAIYARCVIGPRTHRSTAAR